MNKIVKNEVVKAVVTMVHQMMAIAIVMGAAYAIETIAAKQAAANETEVVARKAAGRGQRGRGWHARNDAGDTVNKAEAGVQNGMATDAGRDGWQGNEAEE